MNKTGKINTRQVCWHANENGNNQQNGRQSNYVDDIFPLEESGGCNTLLMDGSCRWTNGCMHGCSCGEKKTERDKKLHCKRHVHTIVYIVFKIYIYIFCVELLDLNRN